MCVFFRFPESCVSGICCLPFPDFRRPPPSYAAVHNTRLEAELATMLERLWDWVPQMILPEPDETAGPVPQDEEEHEGDGKPEGPSAK